MKNLSNQQLLLIKKGVGAICALLCIVLMLFNVFTYTSSTLLTNGEEYLTWKDGFSMFVFLFDGKQGVLETTVSILREIFSFSYVVVWISFILQVISLFILVCGMFSKKSLFSKIGSVVLVVSIASLILISFDTYSLGKTIRYLSVFNVFYFFALVFSVVGLFSTITIKEK